MDYEKLWNQILTAQPRLFSINQSIQVTLDRDSWRFLGMSGLFSEILFIVRSGFLVRATSFAPPHRAFWLPDATANSKQQTAIIINIHLLCLDCTTLPILVLKYALSIGLYASHYCGCLWCHWRNSCHRKLARNWQIQATYFGRFLGACVGISRSAIEK